MRSSAGLPDVLADRDQLMQVFINLLSERREVLAERQRRASRSRSRRAATASRSASPTTAPASRREHQQLIFEKFRQVGDTLSGKPQGSGLGLAICRRIIEHFGGRIWVESEPGRGATFAMLVPYAESEQALAAARTAARARPQRFTASGSRSCAARFALLRSKKRAVKHLML